MASNDHTILVQQYRDAAGREATSNAYGGLRIHALPGLHEFLAEVIVRHVPRDTALLDLAAGSGAMCLRLRDLGYRPAGVDYVTENFRAEGIPFHQADLNDDFSARFCDGGFGAIVASEIIEHLENPRHFARQCARILPADGLLVLSTPNLLNSGSMTSFIRSGRFLWFNDEDREVQGHISPLTPWQIEHALREAGFRVLWQGSHGQGASKLQGSPRMQWMARAIDALSGVPRTLRGEIYSCVAQRLATAG